MQSVAKKSPHQICAESGKQGFRARIFGAQEIFTECTRRLHRHTKMAKKTAKAFRPRAIFEIVSCHPLSDFSPFHPPNEVSFKQLFHVERGGGRLLKSRKHCFQCTCKIRTVSSERILQNRGHYPNTLGEADTK